MTLDITLRAFLAEMARRPFVWGEHDCCLVVADWWLTVHGGEDPAIDFRGTYATEAEARAIIDVNYGLEAIFERMALSVGANYGPTDQSRGEPGSFGVATFPDGVDRGVIATPTGRWATKAVTGIHVTTLRPKRVWLID